MSTHPFPVRAYHKPATGLNSNAQNRPTKGLGYVPPFAADQSDEYKVSLEGCPCDGLSGNWYFYPENKRSMIGGLGFMNPLNKKLFTIPAVNVDVTVGRALILTGAAVAVRFMLKH